LGLIDGPRALGAFGEDGGEDRRGTCACLLELHEALPVWVVGGAPHDVTSLSSVSLTNERRLCASGRSPMRFTSCLTPSRLRLTRAPTCSSESPPGCFSTTSKAQLSVISQTSTSGRGISIEPSSFMLRYKCAGHPTHGHGRSFPHSPSVRGRWGSSLPSTST